jgi:hypothetical protein
MRYLTWALKEVDPVGLRTSFDADILVTSQNGTKLVKICNWTWTTRITKLIYDITILISAWFVFKDTTCMWCIWRCIIYVHWSVRWTTFITFLRTICLLCWRKFYGRHHDLVNRYSISVSQMTTDMILLS